MNVARGRSSSASDELFVVYGGPEVDCDWSLRLPLMGSRSLDSIAADNMLWYYDVMRNEG